MKMDWSLAHNRSKTMVYLGLILITIIASYLQFKSPLKSFDDGPARYTRYNNYVIFKQAHFHLLENKDMYVLYPEEHHDLYKYSPAFALAFGLFAWLPDFIGLTLWNLLNTLVLLFALMHRKALWRQKVGLLLLFCIPELVLATQHAQSNALMTGLLLLSYFDLEANKPGRAVIWIVLATFIKIYAGLGGLLLFVFLRGEQERSSRVSSSFMFSQMFANRRWSFLWKYLKVGLMSTLVLLFIPLLIISQQSLWMQYRGWWQMLAQDHDTSYGLSLMHILNLIFPDFHAKTILQIAGVLSLMILLIPIRKFKDQYLRLEYLAAILLALIIFNHKSESATFIVAVVAIAIWYFSKQNPTRMERIVLGFAFVFTVLVATDIFPPGVKKTWLVPYSVKVWVSIWIYALIVIDLIRKKTGKDLSQLENSL